jgi:hypothetical protein
MSTTHVLETAISAALKIASAVTDPEERVRLALDCVRPNLPPGLTEEQELDIVRSPLTQADDAWWHGEPDLSSAGLDEPATPEPKNEKPAVLADNAEPTPAPPPPFTPAMALSAGRSIFPTGLDKKPLWELMPKKIDPVNGRETPSWKPFQERRATSEEFDLWERSNPPGYAIVTGAISGIISNDFEVRWAELWPKHGASIHTGERRAEDYIGTFSIPAITSRH